jgi:hypothetical protein
VPPFGQSALCPSLQLGKNTIFYFCFTFVWVENSQKISSHQKRNKMTSKATTRDLSILHETDNLVPSEHIVKELKEPPASYKADERPYEHWGGGLDTFGFVDDDTSYNTQQHHWIKERGQFKDKQGQYEHEFETYGLTE